MKLIKVCESMSEVGTNRKECRYRLLLIYEIPGSISAVARAELTDETKNFLVVQPVGNIKWPFLISGPGKCSKFPNKKSHLFLFTH